MLWNTLYLVCREFLSFVNVTNKTYSLSWIIIAYIEEKTPAWVFELEFIPSWLRVAGTGKSGQPQGSLDFQNIYNFLHKPGFHFNSFLMPCPSTGPKLFWAGPNFCTGQKNYLHFVPVPNILCHTKNYFHSVNLFFVPAQKF